jgi:hypothetical protein
MYRYIFTVTAGRSGQATLTYLLKNYVSDCHVSFESPQINYMFCKKHNLPDQHNGILADLERHFRRRFVETHELLGRGKVLSAYADNNIEYIKKITRKRIHIIDAELKKNHKAVYIDVSKHFAKGLHLGFAQLLSEISLIHLVRDPILNMRSFINRDKNFYLDNGSPDSERNMLRMDKKKMDRSDLYLWAWCETALRYESMKQLNCVNRHIEIHTDKLNNNNYMSSCLSEIGLNYSAAGEENVMINTNISSGYKKTIVSKEDVDKFSRFVDKAQLDLFSKIPYLQSYDPYLIHKIY